MATQIKINRRNSGNGGWDASWSNLNPYIPQLNSHVMVDMDCTYSHQEFHLCLLSNVGKIYLSSRNSSQAWLPNLIDIESISTIGSIGPFKDVSCASNNEKGVYICAVTQDGRIVVVYRAWPNTWQLVSSNLEQITSEVGSFNRISCALTNTGILHVCGLTNQGKIFHTLRKSDNTWQNFMGNVSSIMNPTLNFIDIACSVNVQKDLHLCGITQNKVYHTIRYNTPTWQQGFTDIEDQQYTDVNNYHRIGCGCIQNGDLHLCFRTSNGHVYHTCRLGNSWQPFIANINQASISIAPIISICCDGKVDMLFIAST